MALSATMAVAGAAQAAVPSFTHAEGVLSATAGGLAADGIYKVTFGIYKDESGGNPLWVEGPVNVGVKDGQWTAQLGTTTPIPAAAITGTNLWLGMQIGSDPELSRKPLASVTFALRAALADGLECSGCITAAHLKSDAFTAYVKSADLAKVATTGKFSDLIGGPDLTGYVKTSDLAGYAKTSDLSGYAKASDLGVYAKTADLAKVATTGKFSDLSGGPDLSSYAKTADLADYVKASALAKVAGTGSYTDLSNTPTPVQIGKACGTGLVMKGIKADGSYDCATGGGIAADMIDEVSNGLIYNQFVDKVDGTKDIQIKDGFSAGTSDTLAFPSVGQAQKLWIEFSGLNSDMSKVVIELYAPNVATPYILYNGGKTGTAVVAKYNDTDAVVSGDLNKDWLGKDIVGNWTIIVKDTAAIQVPPGTPPFTYDGKYNWSVNIQTLSSKKIQVKGNLIVDGNLDVGGTFTAKIAASMMFPPGSKPFLYGWSVDHTEGNWNYNPQHSYAHQVPIDNASLHAIASQIAYADGNGNIHFGIGGSNYGNGNNDYTRQYLIAFVKNTTAADITRQICFRTSSNPWGNGNYRGISVNTANTWSTTGNDMSGGDCPNVTFPANKASVVVLKSGTYMWTTWNGYWNKSIIGYYNDTWKLPAGLEWDYQRYYDWTINK